MAPTAPTVPTAATAAPLPPRALGAFDGLEGLARLGDLGDLGDLGHLAGSFAGLTGLAGRRAVPPVLAPYLMARNTHTPPCGIPHAGSRDLSSDWGPPCQKERNRKIERGRRGRTAVWPLFLFAAAPLSFPPPPLPLLLPRLYRRRYERRYFLLSLLLFLLCWICVSVRQ